jgi:hypothetical protein
MENKNLQGLLSQQKHSFKPYFSDRVMTKLTDTKEKIEFSFEQALDYLFPRITVSSFAVLGIVLLVAFINNGSMDIDTLLGLSDYEQNIFFQDELTSF